MEAQDVKRQKLFSLLGDLPNSDFLRATTVNEVDKGHYVLECLLLEPYENEQIPAYFARPKEASGKLPVVLFNHSHGGQYHVGKTEMIQSGAYLQPTSYAEQLTSMGYGVFCIDMLGFGERRGKAESEIFKELLWKGQVMWGRMIFDNICALDYLETRGDVDSLRIATLGMSMGGLMAWWLSALEERVKVCIDITGMVDAETLVANQGLDYHGFYSYVPSLLKYFRTSDIQSLIIPRYHLSVAGNHDRLTPFAGLQIINEEMMSAYAQAGVPERWKMIRYNCGHIETAGMRAEVCGFLKNNL